MDRLEQLFQQFLRERTYINNVTTATREWYESAWKAFKAAHASAPGRPASSPLISKADLQQFVVHLRERGVKPVSCNCWLRAMNAFSRRRSPKLTHFYSRDMTQPEITGEVQISDAQRAVFVVTLQEGDEKSVGACAKPRSVRFCKPLWARSVRPRGRQRPHSVRAPDQPWGSRSEGPSIRMVWH
jgi:hypothetical protein